MSYMGWPPKYVYNLDGILGYKVFDFDSDMLIWGDEGAYYRME